MNSKFIKSDILFVNKYGTENKYIYADYDLICEQCNVRRTVTLSSIRNSCIKECSILLNNDAVAVKLFDVTFRWLDIIKKQSEHNKCQITEDEMLLIEQYRKLIPTQKAEVIRLIEDK